MYMEANVIFCLLFRRPSNNGFSVVIQFCIHDKRVSVGLNSSHVVYTFQSFALISFKIHYATVILFSSS